MFRSRSWCALAVLFTPALLSSARGEPPGEKWLDDRSLTLTPAAAPVPAFRFRLFPLDSERTEGNAVPLYLRFAHERSDATKKELSDKPAAWNKLPLDKLPLAEVKEFLQGNDYNLRQIELGARRRGADWHYALDAGNPINMRLGDTQEMRMHAPLLALKARVEIAEGRYLDALRTLETGFSFSQQISGAPFLINGLIGMASATQFANVVLELIERPDAPNLYWALTVLPRPLIDLRRAFDLEWKLLEMQFPDLAELSRPRSPDEWDAALKRVRVELERVRKMDKKMKPAKPGTTSTDAASKSPDLPAARKYLAEVAGMKSEQVDAMNPAEVLLKYVLHNHHELRDEVFKGTYLPFPQSRLLTPEAERRLKSVADTEGAQLSVLFLPAMLKVQLAQARIERRLAALRVIEALRIHAAANGGKLPERLDQVTAVPVPDDPGSGRPFEYRLDGSTAEIISRVPGEPLEATGLRYWVTVRK